MMPRPPHEWMQFVFLRIAYSYRPFHPAACALWFERLESHHKRQANDCESSQVGCAECLNSTYTISHSTNRAYDHCHESSSRSTKTLPKVGRPVHTRPSLYCTVSASWIMHTAQLDWCNKVYTTTLCTRTLHLTPWAAKTLAAMSRFSQVNFL